MNQSRFPQLSILLGFSTLLLVVASGALASGMPTKFSWRYYRPTNTGIQGDYCEALRVTSNGDPWIGGYDPGFEEGGLCRFNQAQNTWVNISNVDYKVIGHPDNTGTSRISDIDVDASGNFWMATGRGGLFYSPTLGPVSLRRFGDDNSPIPGGWNKGVEVAPDGTVWFSSYSTVWGSGGLAKYNPSNGQWQIFSGYGGGPLAVQPVPSGGYYVWTTLGSEIARFHSTSSTWSVLPKITGNPAYLIGKNLTDSAGNTWMYKWTNAELNEYAIDLRRPDGTWANVPPAPFDVQANSAQALRALGPNQALVVDGGGDAFRFDGSSWSNLGSWNSTPYSYDVDIDSAGNVWVCGIGGAAKRDAHTGTWQRYRITNTSQFDFFNADLCVDSAGSVYAGANAGPGVGGMVRFDGVRWTGWNQLTYGLGIDWPFPNDNCEAIAYRPSNGHVVVSPTYSSYGIHEWTGTGFTQVPGITGAKRMAEDSLGRLWALGEYYSLAYYSGTSWINVGIVGWGDIIRIDPDRPGSIYALTGNEIKRTDGVTSFSRTIEDFPELDSQSDQFHGMAVGRNGIVWIGAATIGLPESGVLIRLNTNDGTYTMLRKAQGWPLPGEYVMPLGVSPDGKVWMQYDSEFLVAQRGLCWWDGSRSGAFPAPPGGEAQWGGLPHAAILDLEVKSISGGYELWMSCASRGIAVLTVRNASPRRP